MQVFIKGMKKELSLSKENIERIFPRVEELIDIHTTFLQHLTERQNMRSDKYVDRIGDILVQQVGC